jgi:HD-like signal output (HDOD) protein
MPTTAGPQINILSLVNTTVELPTMPEVLTKINEVTAGANASADTVAAVVSKDPAVAANMARRVAEIGRVKAFDDLERE